MWLYDKENPLDPDTKLSDKSFGCYKAAYNWTIEIQKKCPKGQNTKKYIKMLISQVFDFIIEFGWSYQEKPY